jgi:cbb3-type cytochrome oxidase subunit 1
MGLGIFMAASNDHALAGAHAHLNLVGWVTMALFGIYYHLTPKAAAAGLARVHLAVATLGVLLMVPGIAIAILYDQEGLAIAGSLVTFASMLIFLYTVARYGLGADQ